MEILENILNNDLGQKIGELQQNFLKSSFGQSMSKALDKALKSVLPDSIEEDIIDIKNTFLEEGFFEGINKAIDKATETGRNILKIIKGDFSTVEELSNILSAGDLKGKISDVLEFTLNKIDSHTNISDAAINALKIGKDILLNTAEIGVNEGITSQVKALQEIEKYIAKWDSAYEKEDFKKMEKIYSNIQEEYEKIMPLNMLMTKLNVIDNLQSIIKNNGQNFNLTDEEKALAEIL